MTEKKELLLKTENIKASLSGIYSSAEKEIDEIQDRNGKIIGKYSRNRFFPIRPENLSSYKNLVWAVLVAEDVGYYTHSGVRLASLIRATLANIRNGKIVQGGSTITQQTVKLIRNYKSRTFSDKLVEILLAWSLDGWYNKDTILCIYLNQIYLGEGRQGAEEASWFYYNKPATTLTPAEAAMLAGIIPAPSLYNPMISLKTALTNQKKILNKMKDKNPLPTGKWKTTSPNLDKDLSNFYNIYNVNSKKGKSKIGKGRNLSEIQSDDAIDISEWIRRYVTSYYPMDTSSPIKRSIKTTIDIRLQKEANRALDIGLKKINSKRLEFSGNNIGALITINPKNGEILAYALRPGPETLVYRPPGFEFYRQTGSIFKPLIYNLAIEKKIIHQASIVQDEKLDIAGYSPRNAGNTYRGKITIRTAFAESVNTVPVKLLKELSIETLLLRMSGILQLPMSKIRQRFPENLSLALGSGEMTPLEVSVLYSAFANNGYLIKPTRIISIQDESGKLHPEVGPEFVRREKIAILDPTACSATINLLEAVLSEMGTMKNIYHSDGFPAGGKTGTVQASEVHSKVRNKYLAKDVWFAGITPGRVTIIWFGNENGLPFHGSGAGVAGSIFNIFKKYLKPTEKEIRILGKPEPNAIIQDYCGETGRRLSASVNCKFPTFGQFFYKGQKLPEPELKKAPTPEVPETEIEVSEEDSDSVFPGQIPEISEEAPEKTIF